MLMQDSLPARRAEVRLQRRVGQPKIAVWLLWSKDYTKTDNYEEKPEGERTDDIPRRTRLENRFFGVVRIVMN